MVLDLYARRIVGWALSNKPDADLVIKALDMAYEQRGRPKGLLFHSDQSSHIAAASFANSSGVIASAKAGAAANGLGLGSLVVASTLSPVGFKPASKKPARSVLNGNTSFQRGLSDISDNAGIAAVANTV